MDVVLRASNFDFTQTVPGVYDSYNAGRLKVLTINFLIITLLILFYGFYLLLGVYTMLFRRTIVFLLITFIGCNNSHPDLNNSSVIENVDTSINPSTFMWYDKPAKKWEDAIPVGNGRIGAMVFGKYGEAIDQQLIEGIELGKFPVKTNASKN